MKICIRCHVSGDVQGVGYRAATRAKARALSIAGYARNLPDGRVEVLACGEEQAVVALRNWLWEGPPWARVTNVSWETVTYQDCAGFGLA